jgi:hypothetical protein
MQKSYNPNRYSFVNYDQYLCLKPPVVLWIAILYLSRGLTVPLLVAISSINGGSANTTSLIQGLFSLGTLVPSLIAIPVLCTVMMRSPSAARLPRWIWARGRLLLAVSAVLDLALSWSLLLQDGATGQSGLVSLLAAGFDLYILVYVLASRIVRDVFSDFPSVPDPVA